MTVATAPRLSGGVIASVIFHGGLIAAFFLLRPAPPPPSPPIYRVRLLAAAPGERQIGVVRAPKPEPETPPAPLPPPEITKTVAPRPKAPAIKPKAAPTPKAATANAPPKAQPKKKEQATPEPIAAGGPTGGKGADVANIDTNGLEFPYPWYTANVVSRILQAFHPPGGNFTMEVRFVIQRDGTVDPNSIKPVTRSGNYPFDIAALGAVEAASKNKGFGPLPPGFQEDILPVTFRFSPSLGK